MSVPKNKDIGWMYEGPKSSVNRDDYLLGKRIDKNFELYSDVVRKGRSDNEHFFKKSEKTETVTLPVNVVRTEDPLVAMKVKQEQRKHDLLANPNLKMKAERILRKEFEKIQKKRFKKELKKQLKKEMKMKKKKGSSDSSGSSSEEEAPARKDDEQPVRKPLIREEDLPTEIEPRKRRHGSLERKRRSRSPRARRSGTPPRSKHSRRSSSSSPEQRKKSPVRERNSRKSPERQQDRKVWERRKSPRQSPRKSPEVQHKKRSPRNSPRRSPERRRNGKSPERRPERRSPVRDAPRRHQSPRRRSRSPIAHERQRGRSPEYRRNSPQRQERRRSRSPRGRRDNAAKDPAAAKKAKAEEMEKKRREMLDNAKWKEQVKEDNAKFARAELEKEADSQASTKNAVFIKAFKQRSEEGKTVSDRIQQNRRRLQNDHSDGF